MDMIQIELIQLRIEADNWKEAIRKSALPLLNQNIIEPRYIDNMIQSVEQYGPYIVILPHVALAHARSDEGAIETAIGITTLLIPVEFGNKENDPVRYIFTLSAKDNRSHLSAMAELVELFEDSQFYHYLDHCKDPESVLEYLNTRLKG